MFLAGYYAGQTLLNISIIDVEVKRKKNMDKFADDSKMES